MRIELKHINVLRAGCVTALCYAAAIIVLLPIMALCALANPYGNQLMGTYCLTAIVYIAASFIFSCLGALGYNAIAKYTGGFECTVNIPDYIIEPTK